MTPEERARADAIMEEITKQAKARREHATAPAARIPGISSEPLTPTGQTMRRTVIFALIATLHVAGFIGYHNYAEAKEAEKIAQIKAEAEAATQEGLRRGKIEAERMRELFSEISRDQVKPTKTSPKIQYNVYTPPTPAPRSAAIAPKTQMTVATVTATSRADEQEAGAEKHQEQAVKYAYSHFRYKYTIGSKNYAVTSLEITPKETNEVAGWPRYRTEGEAGLEYYDGSSYKRTTRKFEVMTETKSGRVTATEITVK
jgi:hypothetical protein